jgi:hypothetical protein
LKAFCKRGYRLSLIKEKTEIFGATTMPESLKKIAKVGFNFFPSFFFVIYLLLQSKVLVSSYWTLYFHAN